MKTNSTALQEVLTEVINCNEINFSVRVQLEKISRRIWILDYCADDPEALCSFLLNLALKRGMEKIILPVKTEDLNKIQGNGFIKEATIQGYFRGVNAHFFTSFPVLKRSISMSFSNEKETLQKILHKPKKLQFKLPIDFTLVKATKKDVMNMANLFRKVFSSYPTPVFNPCYLSDSLEKGDLFMAVYHKQRLVGVSAAEIQWSRQNAELTNCATDPEYQGMGINTMLLASLEKTCRSQQINCLYSLSRASSYGMNLILHRLGYSYSGTMINNCHINGRFENMNVWVKPEEISLTNPSINNTL